MSTNASKKRRLRSLVVNAVLIVMALALFGVVLSKHWRQIGDVFSHPIDGRVFALGFAIYLTGLLLTYYRWFRLVKVLDGSFRLRDSVLLGLIGNLFNLVIPGAVGGDVIKAGFLVKMKIDSTRAIASMVIDRILGLLGLFLLAGLAGVAAWGKAPREVQYLIVIAWVAIAGGLIGLLVVFNQSLTRRYPKLLEGHGKLAALLRELKAVSEAYRQKLSVVGGCLALSCASHTMSVLAWYTISRTLFPVGLPTLGEHLLLVPLTLFTMAAPLPFGALGLGEQVSDQLFKLVNHPEGALAMMGFRVLMYGGGLVSFLFYLANLRQVRALTDHTEQLEEKIREGDLGIEPV